MAKSKWSDFYWWDIICGNKRQYFSNLFSICCNASHVKHTKILLKAFEDCSLLPCIVPFICHRGKKGEKKREGKAVPTRTRKCTVCRCLVWTRCGGHCHWGNPSAYWSWQSGQGMFPASGYDICSEPAVSTSTLQNSGVLRCFCGTWHTAPKALLQIHDTEKQTSESHAGLTLINGHNVVFSRA